MASASSERRNANAQVQCVGKRATYAVLKAAGCEEQAAGSALRCPPSKALLPPVCGSGPRLHYRERGVAILSGKAQANSRAHLFQ